MEPARVLGRAPKQLLQELTRPWSPARGERLLCALSGGADSVALATLLAALAPGRGWELHLATVDHGLRGEAGRGDVRFVEELGDRLDTPTRVLRAALPAEASEGAARDARHGLLAAFAEELGGAALALAHTMDDQAETLLDRLTRGTGLAGAGGMTRWRGGRWRPLLRVRRETLRDLLAQLELPWREDETNIGPQATRNRMRHLALPVLERAARREVVPALARVAEMAAEDEALLAALAASAEQEVVLARGPEGVECDLPRLAALDAPLRARVFRRLLMKSGWLGGQLTRAHIDALDRLVTGGGHGTHVDLPGVGAADRRGHRLVLAPRPARPEES